MPAIIEVLKADPLKFLGVYPIKIQCAGAPRSANIYYGQKSSTMFAQKTVLQIGTDPAAQFDAGHDVGHAHIVPGLHGAPQFYDLTDASDLMITNELSGCCLVLDRSGATPRIAHVWPLQGEGGANIQNGLVASHPACKLYGLNNYVTPYSYVVGVRTAGWRFYAQERPMGGKISHAREVLL